VRLCEKCNSLQRYKQLKLKQKISTLNWPVSLIEIRTAIQSAKFRIHADKFLDLLAENKLSSPLQI